MRAIPVQRLIGNPKWMRGHGRPVTSACTNSRDLRDTHLDGVISLANPRSYPGCENKAGKVADLWARRKNAEHPVFDRSTGQRLQPFDFCALAFERHGYIAKETAALIRKLATLKANAFELDPSEEIRKWYTVLSCCVQRANAKVFAWRSHARSALFRSTAPSLRQSRPCCLRVVIASVYRFF